MREQEVGELLARPRVMSGSGEGKEKVGVEEQSIPMQEDRAQEMLERGFGAVRK
jgi:hypothetical protein